MAAYASLVSLLNNIEQMMKHPRLSTSFDNEQIQLLVEKLEFLLEFIEGYNYNHGGVHSREEAEDVERQIASAAHAAEDVIESHIVDQIHDGSTTSTTLDLHQKIEDMDTVMTTVKLLKEKRKGSREEEQPTPTRSRADLALLETGTTRMVGLDDELTQLLDELTGQQSKQHTISIVGMGGMGKTTLAQNVFKHPLIKDHFPFRAWATVSEQHDAKNILTQLLSSLGLSATSTYVDSLGEQLYKHLSGRRYLIVLDDVWSVGAWDDVRRFFPNYGNRSRVLLTTRLSNVAQDCGSSLFQMNLLDEGRSWNLFCDKLVLIQHDGDGEYLSPQLEEIGKEIVRLCKGLALSIVVIGGLLLKAPRTVEYWEGVVEDIISRGPNSKEKEESLDVLSLSYNHLPPRLKPCFLYMGVFKEDSQIRVSDIVKLWVGEGFIKHDGSGRVLEEIAEGFLKELIERNLLLVGKIGRLGIHDLLRDLCLKVAKEQDFYHVIDPKSGGTGTERRLACDWYLNQTQCPLARSILSHGCHSSSKLCNEYKLLRVLHLSEPRKPCKELYGNVNLRYLACIHPSDEHRLSWLPSSVSLLWNLQTLVIKLDSLWRNYMVFAPDEIWKMRQLRHVDCSMIYLPDPSSDDLLIMDKLQTLKVAVNLRLSEEVCKIIPNIKKLHLLYNGNFDGYDDDLNESVCNHLWRFAELESLNLSIMTPDLDTHKKLRFPSSLNKLSLSGCRLDWDDIAIIIAGPLPQLQVLNLEEDSAYRGLRWSPIQGQFLHLKSLKIESCNLRNWDADSSHFPVLENLTLYGLDDLEEIPMDMGEITTLKLIRVVFCSESAAVSAVKIKEDQLENDNQLLQIQLKVSSSDLESLKETLETEGLTLDNCQLQIE